MLLGIEIGNLLPNSQRQHRTLHVQKDVLPNALCKLLCPVSAALASIFQMDSSQMSFGNGTFGFQISGDRIAKGCGFQD